MLYDATSYYADDSMFPLILYYATKVYKHSFMGAPFRSV